MYISPLKNHNPMYGLYTRVHFTTQESQPHVRTTYILVYISPLKNHNPMYGLYTRVHFTTQESQPHVRTIYSCTFRHSRITTPCTDYILVYISPLKNHNPMYGLRIYSCTFRHSRITTPCTDYILVYISPLKNHNPMYGLYTRVHFTTQESQPHVQTIYSCTFHHSRITTPCTDYILVYISPLKNHNPMYGLYTRVHFATQKSQPHVRTIYSCTFRHSRITTPCTDYILVYISPLKNHNPMYGLYTRVHFTTQESQPHVRTTYILVYISPLKNHNPMYGLYTRVHFTTQESQPHVRTIYSCTFHHSRITTPCTDYILVYISPLKNHNPMYGLYTRVHFATQESQPHVRTIYSCTFHHSRITTPCTDYILVYIEFSLIHNHFIH